ncbi:hypothetical protein WFK_00242 [Escherichia phage vB_EcoM_WFK]|nr:hypothetical protein WFK_00242 [Escherichia phage vB_EcoM_WFK]
MAVAFDILVPCLLYTSDAADDRSSVDPAGRRIIKKKKGYEAVTLNITSAETDHKLHTIERCHRT